MSNQQISKSANQPSQISSADPEVLVEVTNVSKKFARRLMTSLKYGAIDILREVLGLPLKEELRKNEFWAVKDVSFTLRRGECLGLIGHNGAGKSTLLKMLNGLIKPDTGSIKMRGRVAALIELGAGFNPILTGRENVYVNGQILGFSRREIEVKFQDIVDFAEIGDFIDTPVQNYSSGMKVRLGFAVAAQMEPDVLIIDEVLAVGDIGFRAKCYNKIYDLMRTSSVIFVTHSMPLLARSCTCALLMNRGKSEVPKTENLPKAINSYLELSQSSNSIPKVIGNNKVKIDKFRINGSTDELIQLSYKDSLLIEMTALIDSDIENYVIRITFIDNDLKIVGQISSVNDHFIPKKNGKIKIEVKLDKVLFNIGKYSVNVAFCESLEKSEGTIFCRYDTIKTIQLVKNNVYSNSPCLFEGNWKLVEK